MNKIFGVGLSRTGTLTLTNALSILGFKSCHFPDTLKKVDDFQGLTDSPIAAYFRKLDRDYPNSKFILTVRNVPDWLDSCAALWESHSKDFTGFVDEIHLRLYGRLDFDRDSFTRAYYHHVLDVISYFEGRDDLLIIDICDGEGWKLLCPFLDKPIPSMDFPHVNSREFLYKEGDWRHDYEEKKQ